MARCQKSEVRQGFHQVVTIVLDSLAQKQARERRKRAQAGKEEVKLS
jgi:hypothetical protein